MHAVQAALPLGAWVPAGHGMHEPWSGDGTVPAPHGAQLSLPTALAVVLCVSTGHFSHAAGVTCPTDAAASMNVPAGHRVQCACPGAPA